MAIDGGKSRISNAAENRLILVPFDKRECINLKEAADVAGKSESTMRGWCEEHGLDRRIGGGTWSVSKVALAMFLDGDVKALRAYPRRRLDGSRGGCLFQASRAWMSGGYLRNGPNRAFFNHSHSDVHCCQSFFRTSY
jgi:hypothetical protein